MSRVWSRLGLSDLMVYPAVLVYEISFAVLSVLMARQLSKGANTLVLVAYPNALAALVLSPFAFFLEKQKRTNLGLVLLAQMFLISLGSASLFQTLLYMGIKETSPSFATAIMNMGPVIIFVMAWALRMEEINIKSLHGQFKIAGTVICVCGAMVMTLLPGPSLFHLSLYSEASSQNYFRSLLREGSSHTRIIGSASLVSAVILLSSAIILQAAALKKYPAPLSIASWTALLGSMEAAIMIIIQNKGINSTSWCLDRSGTVIVIYGGMISQGIAVVLLLWCIQKRGPVFVAVFSPVCTVCSAILSLFIDGSTLNVGSLAGMLLIFVGVYAVLWGKSKDKMKERVLEEEEQLMVQT